MAHTRRHAGGQRGRAEHHTAPAQHLRKLFQRALAALLCRCRRNPKPPRRHGHTLSLTIPRQHQPAIRLTKPGDGFVQQRHGIAPRVLFMAGARVLIVESFHALAVTGFGAHTVRRRAHCGRVQPRRQRLRALDGSRIFRQLDKHVLCRLRRQFRITRTPLRRAVHQPGIAFHQRTEGRFIAIGGPCAEKLGIIGRKHGGFIL